MDDVKNPKKFFAFALALWATLAAAPARADGGDTTRLIVTVKKIEFKDVSGNWVTVAEPDAAVDLMTDQPLLETVNDGRVPSATYVNVRVTLSETVKFSGSDGENKTKEGGVLTFGGTASKASDMPRNEVKTFREDAPTWNKEAEGLVTERIDLDYEDRDDTMEIHGKMPFPKPVVVKEKSVIKVSMGLETKKSVHYAWPDYFSGIASREAMYFVPPKEVSEVSVKSDTTTALLTGESLEWEF